MTSVKNWLETSTAEQKEEFNAWLEEWIKTPHPDDEDADETDEEKILLAKIDKFLKEGGKSHG